MFNVRFSAGLVSKKKTYWTFKKDYTSGGGGSLVRLPACAAHCRLTLQGG